MSETDATKTATVPEGFEDLLTRPLLAHFATVRAGGAPMVNPMWFGWENGCIKMTHTKERQKFLNVQREPRVALSIVDPNDTQRYVEIRGTIESIVDDPGAAYYQQLRQHYGSTGGAVTDAHVRVVLTIRPTTIIGRTGRRGAEPPRLVRG